MSPTPRQTDLAARHTSPTTIWRFLPALTLMAVIFILSSIPSEEMPSFGFWDRLIKKSGHAIGYGLLALTWWHALGWCKERWPAALSATLAYAISDEIHQAFVPGRHPSLVDALVIDGAGALIALRLAYTWLQRRARE